MKNMFREWLKWQSYDEDKINAAIKILTPKQLKLHKKAIEIDGYKDEICPKCGVVFLAHYHFVNCHHAHCGKCPMVRTNSESLLKMLLGEKDA